MAKIIPKKELNKFILNKFEGTYFNTNDGMLIKIECGSFISIRREKPLII
jgi:hypothetical protein